MGKRDRYFVGFDIRLAVAAGDAGAARETALGAVGIRGKAAPVGIRLAGPGTVAIPGERRYKVFLQVFAEIRSESSERAHADARESLRFGPPAQDPDVTGWFAFPGSSDGELAETAEEIIRLPGAARFIEAAGAAAGVEPTEQDHQRAAAYLREIGASPGLQTIMRSLLPPSVREARPARGDYVRCNEILEEMARQPGVVAVIAGQAA